MGTIAEELTYTIQFLHPISNIIIMIHSNTDTGNKKCILREWNVSVLDDEQLDASAVEDSAAKVTPIRKTGTKRCYLLMWVL